jgi:Beta-lactamase superfamily domain
MIVTFHGGQLVRFQTGDFVIAVNPGVPPVGTKSVKFGSDMVLCASFASDQHNIDAVTYSDREPFVIDGPGQYEYKGYAVLAEPIGTGTSPEHLAVVYRFEMDGITIAVLGGTVAKEDINPDISELSSEVDIMIVPISGETVAEATRLVHFFDPKVVIPVGFQKKDDAQIALFAKENGGIKLETEKWTVKRKEIEGWSKQVVLITV